MTDRDMNADLAAQMAMGIGGNPRRSDAYELTERLRAAFDPILPRQANFPDFDRLAEIHEALNEAGFADRGRRR